MARFTSEQAVAYVAIQALVNEWAHELDMHNGVNIGQLITEDCSYGVAGTPVVGRAAIEKSYTDRITRLSATPTGVPIHRHMLSNLCVAFRSDTEVSITFSLLYFTALSSNTLPDVAAAADVRMNCRKEPDGHWRISLFDSNQPFRRG